MLQILAAGAGDARAQEPVTVLFDVRWSVMLDAPASAAPAFDAGRVYVPLQGGQLAAVALERGELVWSVHAGTTLAPAAGQALVFVAAANAIRALEAASGREMWATTLADPVTAAPTFDAGWLFVPLENGRLQALRAVDGKILWSLDAGAALHAPPAPAADRVYLPLADGRVVAVELQTGEIVWTRRLDAPPSEILPLDDRLFVGSEDNYFYCLTLDDGRNRWRWRTGGDVVGAPIVDTSRVYFMSRDNLLRGLDRAGGSMRWQRPVPSRTIGGPLRSGSSIVIASLRPQLHAYQDVTGNSLGVSPPLEGDATVNTLIAPPRLVSFEGEDGFVLLSRHGALQLLTFKSEDEGADPDPDGSEPGEDED